MPPGVTAITPATYEGPDFGWALFQLMVQNIDSRAGARPAERIFRAVQPGRDPGDKTGLSQQLRQARATPVGNARLLPA